MVFCMFSSIAECHTLRKIMEILYRWDCTDCMQDSFLHNVVRYCMQEIHSLMMHSAQARTIILKVFLSNSRAHIKLREDRGSYNKWII